jgi:stage II sporulation protein D
LLTISLLPGILAADQQDPQYRVRLFWLHPPASIDIAPSEEATSTVLPVLSFNECKDCRLRNTLRLTAAAAGLVAGERFPQPMKHLHVQGIFQLRLPDGGWQELRGGLEVSSEGDALAITWIASRPDYLVAVLAGEAGGLAEQEALRAIAVAARSYAFASPARHAGEGFDFCDTTHCQNLRLAGRTNRLANAVADTRGELLWEKGKPLPGFYHKNSGGHTLDASLAWPEIRFRALRGVPDEWSAAEGWSTSLNRRDIANALRAEGFAVSEGNLTLEPGNRAQGGQLLEVFLNRQPMRARDFRFAIGRRIGWQHIRSDNYEIEDADDRYHFAGRGAGHGVGLSQQGAERMAAAGKSYREILRHYFPGARVGIAAQGIEWKVSRGDTIELYFDHSGDIEILALAEAQLAALTSRTGWRAPRMVRIYVYADIDTYRNRTGNAGDVAATTSVANMHLQPVSQLRRRGMLERVLRHELVHAAMAEAGTRLPLWFEEGLARYLAGPEYTAVSDLRFDTLASLDEAIESADSVRRRAAYAQAHGLVQQAVNRFGERAVLGWAVSGLGEREDVFAALLHNGRSGRQ